MTLSNRIITLLAPFGRINHWLLAGAMLTLMLGLGIDAMAHDSAIVDEVAHIPAAYSYIHYGDYRLNPEHPPLIKDLAGIPLQFMHLKFPDQLSAWTTEANGQWETGWNFIYHIGNDADVILFWARLPILLLAIGFGLWLYVFAFRRWGKGVALLALFFYTLSPNIIAHAHYVTTDLGASVFTFLALVALVNSLQKPGRRSVLWLSLALAGAQLAKFNGFLLYPFMGLCVLIAILAWRMPEDWIARTKTYLGGFIVSSALSLLWVWIYYIPHTINMSKAVQDNLIQQSLVTDQMVPVVNFLTSINGLPLLKPLAQYILGLLMVFTRVSGGNVTYLNGVVINGSFHEYFPELFVVKTQIPLLLLGVASIVFALVALRRRKPFKLAEAFTQSLRSWPLEWLIGGYALFYFGISVASNLNLGIRHILPIYVPIFVLVAIGTMRLIRAFAPRWQLATIGVMTALLVWYGGSTLSVHPHYTAYFNELIGGPANSGKYFSDSSVDWGQDLIRLKSYVAGHPEIKHIAVDYFGGGDTQYYFCDRKYDEQGRLIATAAGYDCSHSVYEPWHSQFGRYPGQYIAVSETFLENDRYYSKLLNQPGYDYLRVMKPIAKVGYSIYVFKLY